MFFNSLRIPVAMALNYFVVVSLIPIAPFLILHNSQIASQYGSYFIQILMQLTNWLHQLSNSGHLKQDQYELSNNLLYLIVDKCQQYCSGY